MATLNGNITAFGVRSRSSLTTTLRIYAGGAGSGTPGNIGAPLYTQANVVLVDALTSAPAGGFTNITLTTPLPVTTGQTYTFMLTAAVPLSIAGQSTNPYAPGGLLTNFAATPFPTFDLAFQVFEVAAALPVASPAGVPTLGEWTLLALMGLLAWLGARALPARRPKQG